MANANNQTTATMQTAKVKAANLSFRQWDVLEAAFDIWVCHKNPTASKIARRADLTIRQAKATLCQLNSKGIVSIDLEDWTVELRLSN